MASLLEELCGGGPVGPADDLDWDCLADGPPAETQGAKRSHRAREVRCAKANASKEETRKRRRYCGPYDLEFLSLAGASLAATFTMTAAAVWGLARLAFQPRARGKALDRARKWQVRGQALVSTAVLALQVAALRTWCAAKDWSMSACPLEQPNGPHGPEPVPAQDAQLEGLPHDDAVYDTCIGFTITWDETRARLRALVEGVYGKVEGLQQDNSMNVGTQVMQTLITCTRVVSKTMPMSYQEFWNRQTWFCRPIYLLQQTAKTLLEALWRNLPVDLSSPCTLR